MSRSPTAQSSSFPSWVAVSSVGIGLWLFFANAVPAVHERSELRALVAEFEGLRRNYDAAIAETRLARGPNTNHDLQGLLVAIDRLGLTPAELCAAYPVEAPRTDLATSPAGGPAPGAVDPTGADFAAGALPAPPRSAQIGNTRTKFQ